MRLPALLTEPYRQIWTKVFHPTPDSPLTWREVRSLMREIAQVKWQPNGDFKIVRNGHILILRPAPSALVSGPDELLELQRFLERSEAIPPYLDPTRERDESPPVVVTPQAARPSQR